MEEARARLVSGPRPAIMIHKLKAWLLDSRDRDRIAIGLARGAAGLAAREVDPRRPGTWEFSGFSQNGEDGILDVLRRRLTSSHRYFAEIGASDGLENNTAWLAIAEKWAGLMVEGDEALADRAARLIPPQSVGAEVARLFVTRENAGELAARLWFQDPDVLSLDIDGNDYYVARAVLDAGLRPKILIVEFNSVFGPERSVTIPYREGFVFSAAHASQLYYGVSIAAWRKFLGERGYRFVTVDRNGVNAFFVDPRWFEAAFLDGVEGLPFAENRYQLRRHRVPSERQFELIAGEPLVTL